MTGKTKILIIFLIGIIGLFVYLEANEPTPINWFPSYAKTDKIPLGTYVLHDLIKSSSSLSDFKDINQPPYEYISENDSIQGTYIFVNGSVNFGNEELDKLLSWVEKGNTLFISAKNIENKLLDTLKVTVDNLVLIQETSTKPLVNLTNANLKQEVPFLYDRDIYNPYFDKIDTLKTQVLGITQLYRDTLQINNPKVNYIQNSFGKGKILLHTFPEAFGNYFLLTDTNYTYTQNVLAYINPARRILWDNYYKSGKTFYSSPLFLLLSNRYLKWAYYFILIGVVLFVIFEGKRKQRSIPIINPLKNQSIAFTRTISGMYFEKQKHKEIATKQNLLFLEYVRNVLRIPTNKLTEKTIQDIATRSNNTIEDTKALFRYFDEISKKQTIEKAELMRMYELINAFKNRS